MKPAVSIATVLFASGCLPATEFVCEADGDCGGDGRCESTHFCSFVDAACEGGRRYGQESGAVGNQCVPPGTTLRCPDGYQAVNGSPNLYRRLANADDWDDHRDRCAAEGTFLAIPDDATELALILDLAGDDVWVGISDEATEGSFVTVLGAPATFLPWTAGEPDNANDGDCVRISDSSRQLRDDRCTSNFRAVCECVPR